MSKFLRSHIKTNPTLNMKQLYKYTKSANKAKCLNDTSIAFSFPLPVASSDRCVAPTKPLSGGHNDITQRHATVVTPEITVNPDVSSSAPSSMSLRRLASNRPALHCHVDLPPIPIFPLQLDDSSLNTPALLTILPLDPRLRSDEKPLTPIAQIMPHTPENPPQCTHHDTRKPKHKLKLDIDTAKPQRALEKDSSAPSPDLPFTPLETPTLCGSVESDGYPFDLTQRLSALKMGISPSPPNNPSGNQPTSSSPARKTFKHLLPITIPRRLSYRLSTPHSLSPLSTNVTPRGSQTSEAAMLASPLDLQNRSLRKTVYGLPDTPILKPACSPLNGSSPPLSYFSLHI